MTDAPQGSWPQADPAILAECAQGMPVTVDGKKRAMVDGGLDCLTLDILDAIDVANSICDDADRAIARITIVPGKTIAIVTEAK